MTARRRGFMLREMVAVIFIWGFLTSALLPSIQAVRETARRMQCANHLKLLSVATFHYEGTYTKLPAGVWRSFPSAGDDLNAAVAEGNWGWGAGLLPYASEVPPYAMNTRTSMPSWLQSADSQVGYDLSFFRCPSSQSPLVNTSRVFASKDGRRFALPLSNYVGANGSAGLQRIGNGILFVNSSLKFDYISDGTSTTILLGERAWQTERGRWWVTRQDSRAAVVFGARGVREKSQHGLADTLACGRYKLNGAAVDGPSGIRQGFSSCHPRGASFVFADGSVHFLSDEIDADIDPAAQATRTEAVDSTFERLLSRSDGQQVGEF